MENELYIAVSLDGIAKALTALGNNNASTPMGAIENLSKEVGRIADAILELAEAVRGQS